MKEKNNDNFVICLTGGFCMLYCFIFGTALSVIVVGSLLLVGPLMTDTMEEVDSEYEDEDSIMPSLVKLGVFFTWLAIVVVLTKLFHV